MWTVLKFNKNELSLLREDLKKKLENNFKIYIPKLRVQKFKKNKLINKELNLLGDYMFFFHESLISEKCLNLIKFSRGLKYFLNTFNDSQVDIQEFIDKCKKLENKEGYLTKNFFDLEMKKKYRFSSGPFADKIFKIIDLNKNKIKVLIGNVKTTLNRKELLFSPI